MAVATKDTLATGLDNDFSEGINWGGRVGGYDQDMYASKQREAAAIARQAPQIDYSQTNASLAQAAALAQQDAAMRGQQQHGLGMLQAQAAGQTPSAAAINAGQGTQMGLSGALQGMASGHTSLANAAATRQGLMAGSQAQLANVGQASAARSQELANANQSFAAAAGQARAGDYGLANGMTGIGSMQGAMAHNQSLQNLQQQQLNQQYAEQQEKQRFAMGQAMSQGEQNTLNRYYAQKSDYYKDRAAEQAKMDVIAGTVASSASYGMAGAATSMGGGAGDGYAGGYSGAQMAGSTGGVSSGGMMQNQAYSMPSDARAKEAAWDVLPLYEPEGMQLHQGDDGRAYYQSQPEVGGGGVPAATLASAASMREAAPQAKAKLPAAERKMTDAELMAAADREIDAVKADTARREAEGPALRRAGGGDASNGYNTQLTQGAEKAYLAKFGKGSDADYDLRGAFAAGLTDGARTQFNDQGGAYFPDHLPDTYKKPNHETFSNESQYAQYAPERAGHWNGDTFIAPDQGVMAGANRAMAGQPYRYKPEFTPPDEVPGQIHHGFMAQNLEQNPVTATAVETGPGGVKQVHSARMMQAMASGLSDLQRQVDETRAALAATRSPQ